MSEAQSLLGLFLSSFLASTLLPGGSEVTLLWMSQQQMAPPGALLAVATLGNTLGGLSSWLLGWWMRRRFPQRIPQEKRQQQAMRWLQAHGAPLLLLSWLPIIGDPLCLIAGWLRISPLSSGVFIASGKAARYAVLLWLSAP